MFKRTINLDSNLDLDLNYTVVILNTSLDISFNNRLNFGFFVTDQQKNTIMSKFYIDILEQSDQIKFKNVKYNWF